MIPEKFTQLDQSIQRNAPVPTLNIGDILPRKVKFFRQLFPGIAELLALVQDLFADSAVQGGGSCNIVQQSHPHCNLHVNPYNILHKKDENRHKLRRTAADAF